MVHAQTQKQQQQRLQQRTMTNLHRVLEILVRLPFFLKPVQANGGETSQLLICTCDDTLPDGAGNFHPILHLLGIVAKDSGRLQIHLCDGVGNGKVAY